MLRVAEGRLKAANAISDALAFASAAFPLLSPDEVVHPSIRLRRCSHPVNTQPPCTHCAHTVHAPSSRSCSSAQPPPPCSTPCPNAVALLTPCPMVKKPVPRFVHTLPCSHALSALFTRPHFSVLLCTPFPRLVYTMCITPARPLMSCIRRNSRPHSVHILFRRNHYVHPVHTPAGSVIVACTGAV